MAQVLPQDIVSRIKEETDIVALVRGYVTLKPSGAGFKGLCPFHREKTPSFHVSPDRQIFKCFGCDEGGDAISFLMKIESISFPEALEALARPLDIDLSRYLREDEDEGERLAFYRANEMAAGIWQQSLWQGGGQLAREYLRGRGFGDEILQRFEVGFAPRSTEWFVQQLQRSGVALELAQRSGLLRAREGEGVFAYFRGRSIFPIKNIAQRAAGFGGRILGPGDPKYLNSPESAYFNKGKLLYGFASSRIAIARFKTAVLVEGYLDLLAMAQAGFANVVATCGTAFTAEQAALLRRGCRTVLILFDGDGAGLKAAVRASHIALAAGLEPKVAQLSNGEDPASFLQERDREAMEVVLGAARGYLPFLHGLVQQRGAGRQAKERALRQGLKSIALVTDQIRQEYLLQEAADLFGIGVGILRDHLQQQQAAGIQRRPPAEARQPEGRQHESPEAPVDATEAGGVRSFAAVNRPAIEATLLAHVLKDASGQAAGLLLQLDGGRLLVTPEAVQLYAELEQWLADRQSGRQAVPAQFVQDRWHDKSESYRRYVSHLLTQEVVPDHTDFARVVHDCLGRLQQAPQRARA